MLIKGTRDHQQIERALDYLQTHFLKAPSLKEVADVVHMSKSAFSRFFKRKTGMTPSRYRKASRQRNLSRDQEKSLSARETY